MANTAIKIELKSKQQTTLIPNKDLCDCGKTATWCYGPGYSNGSNPNSCDDCVTRGCTCNHYSVDVNAYHPPLSAPILPEGKEGVDWKWIELDKVWCHIDEFGRDYPCCEYMYSEDGWDIEIDSNS